MRHHPALQVKYKESPGFPTKGPSMPKKEKKLIWAILQHRAPCILFSDMGPCPIKIDEHFIFNTHGTMEFFMQACPSCRLANHLSLRDGDPFLTMSTHCQ